MKRERLPAKFCEFVETFLPVDLCSSPTSKIWPWGQTDTISLKNASETLRKVIRVLTKKSISFWLQG